MTAPAPPLAADLTAGLRRLKLSAMRHLAPELLVTAKTQRWTPEDLLRIQRESRGAGHDILGYYHSHPDHPARPSETDRRIAAGGLSDGVVHMVVGVTGAGTAVPAAWLFRDALQAFEPEPLDVD